MKRWCLVVMAAVLAVSASAQEHGEKGAELCSRKKSSAAYTPLLPQSPTSPRHAYDALHYALDLDLYNCFLSPYPKSFTGSNTVTFRVDTALSAIQLNAVNTSLVIDSVQLAGASFTHASNILTVTLDRTYAAGETTQVRIFYRHQNVSDDAFYTGSGMVFTDCEPEGARKWFPCWDRPSDKATVDIRVKTPATVKLGSNGRLADSVRTADTIWYSWISRDPVATYLVVLTGKVGYNLDIVNWPRISDPADSIPVRFYWNTGESQTSLNNIKTKIVPMTTRFSELFGEFPFEKNGFATLNSQFQWGGMENQTLTSLCANCWGENLVSHEHAHQWFGDMITCATWADIWLNEGFATYSEALWYEYTGGYTAYKNDINNDASSYLSGNPGWPIYNPSWAVTTPPNSTLFNYAITYAKSATILHLLRYVLGDSLFFGAVKSYAADTADYRHQSATTADFIQSMSAWTGQDLDWFFQQWVYQPNHPVYANTYNINAMGSGNWMVAFRARQTQANPAFFQMPIELKFTFASGPDTTVRVFNHQNNQVWEFWFTRQPTAVQFDPGNNIVIKQGSTVAGVTAPAPALIAPAPGDTLLPSGVSLLWNRSISATSYGVQVATDAAFTALVVNDSTVTDTSFAVRPLPPDQQYYWRVRGRNAGGSGEWSAVRSFRTQGLLQIQAARGWNLLALPLHVADSSAGALFPNATSLFAYMPDSGYIAEDTLAMGHGYWVKFDSAETVGLLGAPVSTIAFPVSAGWNLIGGVTSEVPLVNVGVSPPDNLASGFFSFDGQGYAAAQSLLPGRGYWVKMHGPGLVVVSSSAGEKRELKIEDGRLKMED